MNLYEKLDKNNNIYIRADIIELRCKPYLMYEQITTFTKDNFRCQYYINFEKYTYKGEWFTNDTPLQLLDKKISRIFYNKKEIEQYIEKIGFEKWIKLKYQYREV